ncbi:zinc finger, CCHC-type containing protein [Tanacetum coccineum]
MLKDGLIPAFDMDTEKCKTCMLTKITKKPFQNVKRETKVLELIHSDLCDLHATPSLGNKKYFVTFIDDASRVPNKRNKITPYELWTKRKPNLNYLRVWGYREDVRLPDPKLKTLGERGIKCIFVGYAEHSKAFRFFVIEPNDSVAINLIIESRDAIFDENRFSLVPRPSLRIPNGTKDISGSVVPEEVTKEVVQQPEPELRKSKRNRNPKNFGPEFQLYLIEGTRDEVSDQHSYCFNVEDDPKTFDKAMKSQDVAFWKEAINDEMDSIMGNNTWVLADLPPGCKPLGCKWIFKRKLKVDGTIENTKRLLIAMVSIHNLIIHQMDVKTDFLNGDLEEEAPKQWHQKFDEVVLSNDYLLNQADKCVDLTKELLSSKFSIKDMGKADVILVSTPMDTSEKLMPNNSQAVSQLKYSKVIGCLMYAMTCTRPDIVFVVGKLSSLTYSGYPSILEGYTTASWISNTKDNSSTSGWVILLAAGKEAEWLKNLLLEILLWSKPIAHISIHRDSVATLAKAYSQMYNGKSRHVGVRHSMIHELIMNGVISIEFVRTPNSLLRKLQCGKINIQRTEAHVFAYHPKDDSNSDVVEDTRSISEFLADLNAEFHDRAFLANQKRFYKRSGRVGSARKPMDKSNETCFACGKQGHFRKDCPTTKTSSPSYPSLNKSYKPKFQSNSS